MLAAGISASVHGALFAVVLTGAARWQYRLETTRVGRTAPVVARYVALDPLAPASAPRAVRHASAPASTTRAARRKPKVPLPELHIQLATRQPSIRPVDGPPALPPIHARFARAPVSAPLPAAASGDASTQARSRETSGLDGRRVANATAHGDSRVVELVGPPGAACPQLRQPPGWHSPRGILVVAVVFAVDSRGRVAPESIRVVEPATGPRLADGYFSHGYVVGQNTSVDHNLRKDDTGWGTEVTDEVVRHVSMLAFHPAMRNGQPERSTVLVSCQAS
jgi:hypothetical protein